MCLLLISDIIVCFAFEMMCFIFSRSLCRLSRVIVFGGSSRFWHLLPDLCSCLLLQAGTSSSSSLPSFHAMANSLRTPHCCCLFVVRSFVRSFVCLFVCLVGFVCLCVCLLACLLVCLFVCLFVRLSIVAPFRVARFTLQTRKLWLVDVATGRNARDAALFDECMLGVRAQCFHDK